MSVRGYRRRIVLFIAAILVPCLVLVALGLRLIGQERELAEKRLTEDRQRLVSRIRQELLSRLERIKLQEVSALSMQKDSSRTTGPQNTLVALVSHVEQGRVMLPWEDSKAIEEFHEVIAEGRYGAKIEEGEQDEFFRNQISGAINSYREALGAARHPAQVAYAQLLLSRALVKSGRQNEACAIYGKVLIQPSGITDESGMSLWLYAAERLLQMGVEHKAVFDRIRSEISGGQRFSPSEAYLLDGLLKVLANEESGPAIRENVEQSRGELSKCIRDLEQALALQKDFAGLPVQAGAGQSSEPESVWVPYGEYIWLVSLVLSPVGERSILLAVRGDELLASLNADDFRLNEQKVTIRFITGSQSEGELLGESFPGLRVAIAVMNESELQRAWDLQLSFYLIALFLVLSITLFGAYLLWRDVRRDLRLADMRSQFVSSVSHELKTPLTSIRMFAETLRMRRATSMLDQDEYLDTIINESERLTRLLNNVLDFSKIEQGKKTYHFHPISLDEVVRASIQALGHPLKREGFDLQVDLEDGLPDTRADRDALEQAILNLLTNAMKYSGESRRIGLRLHRQNGNAVIQVSDSGLGISQEEQHRVFEKFYRSPAPEVRHIPGTGLGLTLVEHIAKAHGGRVEVQSEPGEGSTFSIHIPLENVK